MALATVSDYVSMARTLLQDVIAPYRYADADIVNALNIAVLESTRVRPDLWLPTYRSGPPTYSTSVMGASVVIDPQYSMAFVYYMVGMSQLQDQEGNNDERAIAFLNKFIGQLTATQG